MPTVTGTTRIIGIIADPIAHVRTPEVLNTRFAQEGVDALVIPLHVTPLDLSRVWEGLRRLQNLDGLVVTVPHKAAVTALCDELSVNARLTGAANAIHRRPDGAFIGEMFDGIGFVEGLRRQGRDTHGKRTLLIGAGGAASAIAFSLAQADVAALAIANRSPDKRDHLVQALSAAFPQLDVRAAEPHPSGYDLVINGTSLGLKSDDALPLDPATLQPGTTVAEVIMQPARTRLLKEAAERGCDVHEGAYMLEAQLDLLSCFVLSGQNGPSKASQSAS